MNTPVKKYALLSAAAIMLVLSLFFACRQPMFSSGTEQAETVPAPAPDPAIVTPHKPKYVRGIHVTVPALGSSKLRPHIDEILDETEVNTIVIAIKDEEGRVYIPGVRMAEAAGTYARVFPGLQKYITDLKSKGVYTIARIVVFRDALMPIKRPELGVKNQDGTLWKEYRGITWLDPTNRNTWEYTIAIAERAVELGFEEIQFDYIRFPSDGNVKNCRYSVQRTTTSANQALVGFLKTAHGRLKPMGANISIDVFGLTTTVTHDMGIGQRITDMAQWVDFVSPMVYPSHYNPGEYGIPNPNAAPYRTVYMGIEGAVNRLGAGKVRPYLQDFSWKMRYGAKEVRDQIQATYDNNVGEWLLWNAGAVYTRGALKDKKHMDTMEKSPVIPREGKPVHRNTVVVSSAPLQDTATGPIETDAIAPSTGTSAQ